MSGKAPNPFDVKLPQFCPEIEYGYFGPRQFSWGGVIVGQFVEQASNTGRSCSAATSWSTGQASFYRPALCILNQPPASLANLLDARPSILFVPTRVVPKTENALRCRFLLI